MIKSSLSLAILGLAALGVQQRDRRPTLHMKEEQLTLEYTVTAEEAVVLFEAEAEEALGRIEIRDPSGHCLFDMRAREGEKLALQGFLIETRETGARSLFETYAAGDYDIVARTVDGQRVTGKAKLSHGLLPAPVILQPLEGQVGVPTAPLVGWIPDPEAAGYRVILEQNENDGLTVELPPGTSSFKVPGNFLAPGTETILEVGAIGQNGNCTLVEITFTTM